MPVCNSVVPDEDVIESGVGPTRVEEPAICDLLITGILIGCNWSIHCMPYMARIIYGYVFFHIPINATDRAGSIIEFKIHLGGAPDHLHDSTNKTNLEPIKTITVKATYITKMHDFVPLSTHPGTYCCNRSIVYFNWLSRPAGSSVYYLFNCSWGDGPRIMARWSGTRADWWRSLLEWWRLKAL